MAEVSFPFDGTPAYEDQWSKMARLWSPDGVVAGSPAITLGTGLQFTVPVAFAAWIQGSFYEVTTAAETRTAVANGSPQPRLDSLVLRRDPAANQVTAVIKQGTASASPVKPALTRVPGGVWEIRLATARVPGSGSTQNYSQLARDSLAIASPDAETYTPVLSTAEGGNLDLGAGGTSYGEYTRDQRKGDLNGWVQFGSGLDGKWGPINISLPPGWQNFNREYTGGTAKLYHSPGVIFEGFCYMAAGATTFQVFFPNSRTDTAVNPWRAAENPGEPGSGVPTLPDEYAVIADSNLTYELRPVLVP